MKAPAQHGVHGWSHPTSPPLNCVKMEVFFPLCFHCKSGLSFPGVGNMPLVSCELGGCWESVHRTCLSPTHASTLQMNYRSTSCALIFPRHLHWLGAIFHGWRVAPFLSYHNHLGLSVWCVPCLIPLPSSCTPPQIPC